jgi:hypothetical protein
MGRGWDASRLAGSGTLNGGVAGAAIRPGRDNAAAPAAMDAGGLGGVTGGFTSRRSGSCCHLSVSSALVSRWFSACTCVRLGMDHERRARWIVGWPGIGETDLSKSPDCPRHRLHDGKIKSHLRTNCWNPVPDDRLPADSRSWHGTRLSWHPLPGFGPGTSPHHAETTTRNPNIRRRPMY